VGGRAKKATRSKAKRPQRSRPTAVASRIQRRIQRSLSLDLLHANYRDRDANALYYACQGHCYAATEALYYLYGRAAGFVPYVFKHDNGDTHWWLANPETGLVLDPTEPQLDGMTFPYERGRRQAFLTPRPSRRAAEIIRRVRAGK
jgi:hypothetical protein